MFSVLARRTLAVVDPFAIIMLGGTLGLVIALVLVARGSPGSGADLIDWKPTRSAEAEAQNELDDMAQLLEVANRRRRRRGEAEITEEGMRESLAEQEREAQARLDADLVDEEVQQMLRRVNIRRRARGLPELSADEYRAQIEQEHWGGS
jgi:hypothetical protein